MRIGLSFKEPLVGEAMACLLESRRNWSVGFVAESVREALGAIAESPVDLLLVDTLEIEAESVSLLVALRDEEGPSVVLLVAEPHPGAYLDLPVDRVVSRRANADELLAALDEWARSQARGRANALPFDLTRREHECAQLVSRGLSNRRIAELTGLREQSVKNVVSLAMRKLGVDNRVQIALRLGGSVASAPVHAVVSLSTPALVTESVGAAE